MNGVPDAIELVGSIHLPTIQRNPDHDDKAHEDAVKKAIEDAAHALAYELFFDKYQKQIEASEDMYCDLYDQFLSGDIPIGLWNIYDDAFAFGTKYEGGSPDVLRNIGILNGSYDMRTELMRRRCLMSRKNRRSGIRD